MGHNYFVVFTLLAWIPTSVSAIVNGTSDAGGVTRDSVVRIGNGCSGTLIAPRIVVTAGHCLPEALRALSSPVSGLPATDPGDNVLVPSEWYPHFVNPSRGVPVNFGSDSSSFTTIRALHYRPAGFQDVVFLGLSESVPSLDFHSTKFD